METKKKEEKIGFRDVKRILGWYWKLTKKHNKWLLFTLLAYGIAVILSDVYVVLLFKKIIDILSGPQIFSVELKNQLAVLIGVFVVYGVLYRLGDLGLRKYQVPAKADISRFTFSEVQKHSYAFFSNSFVGSLTSQMKRFEDGFNTLSEGIIFVYWWQTVSLVSIMVAIFILSKPLALIFFVCVTILFLIATPSLKQRMQYDEMEGEASSKISGHFSDTITNILNVKVFSALSFEKQRFEKVVLERFDVENESFRSWNRMVAIQAIAADCIRALLLLVAIYLWSKGDITVGTVVSIITFSQSVFHIIFTFTRSTSNVLKSMASAKEMIDIFELKQDVADFHDPQEFKAEQGEIKFLDVDFSYDLGEKVFQGLSFTVAPGEHVGLVGPSGGGKSTVTKLLLRFVEPTSGTISIDGQDITKVRQDDLRAAIAYVPQDPALFHRSLRENISYAKPEATDAEIIEAAKKSHAHEFIGKLKEGYDTLVGERGVKLSGGQRQRIAIARAILKNAPILVMDEATSALDTISEVAIREAISELIENKTAIIIAHRLSTVEKMDRIIVLSKDGAIEEEGSHSDLINRGGLYSTLWNHQTGGFLPADEDSEEETEESIGA